MFEQVSPLTTRWNLLQLPVIPGCIGVGVLTPFPGVVVFEVVEIVPGGLDVDLDGVVRIVVGVVADLDIVGVLRVVSVTKSTWTQ
jgi:hypothetical protein